MEEMAAVGGSRFLVFNFVIMTLLQFTQASGWKVVPRKTVSHSALKEVKRFSKPNIFNYTTLRLDEDEQILYVGAREAVFALLVHNITKEVKETIVWDAPIEKKMECVQKGKDNQTDCFNYIRFLQNFNSTHLYACGTYAFQPRCTYIDVRNFTLNSAAMEDGKGKFPYGPAQSHTGLIVDGEFYSATLNNFLGTEAVILRHLGQHYSTKTEHLASWLNEPNFVGSAYIQESANSETGDDDKIYFFFSERAVEYDCYREQVVARVARVCKGDMGGARTLQKKWTTFLKARLLCSVPEQQLHFNNFQSVYTLIDSNWQSTVFFGIFRAQWADVDVSAVCQYRIKDIQQAFDGPYKEYRDQAQKWGRYSGKVPSPRPGACIMNSHRLNGYNTSLELPDNTLSFAKKHPLMDDLVQPVDNQPLLIQKNINYTQIVVDRVLAVNGNQYDVLFIGTGAGWLHKAVMIGSQMHIIEELQLFEEMQPVESLAISKKKKLLFAGSRSQVVQIPFADCEKYRSCADCILARDPYCVWTKQECTRIDALPKVFDVDQDVGQDVEFADVSLCHRTSDNLKMKNLTIVAGTNIFLPCQLISNLAVPKWTFQQQDLAHVSDANYEIQRKALLISDVGSQHGGSYCCFSEEKREPFLMGKYSLSVVSNRAMALESQAAIGTLGLVWLYVFVLGIVCVCLLGVVIYLNRKLKERREKTVVTKEADHVNVYPTERILPKELPKGTKFIPSQTSSSDEKLWESPSYYYSDGSLKIVPGHALCQNGSSPSHNGTANGIPGQPLPTAVQSPTRLNLANIRGANTNGYIRLQLGEEGVDPFSEELRKKLKQRQMLPDANPEESSV
ncbi:semaphorin-4C [Carcharodon carcharias]|uniref:semaphorin-4C n=1 Tax=Carcharodon carcharias TaxID=13397 RepID=UPI001B7E7FB8|nr:semaphorin-4C [Carcharodon carcharias]XP_041065268.1 semaphorin-4C [Carcharodon carcharias]XP_041065269.1 semaphorin-4C [Carcharodon carcharias]XP_041065270.1 semaphorin-4C [Carcharodon carcharias]